MSVIASKVDGGFIQVVLTDPNGDVSTRVAGYIRDDIDSGNHGSYSKVAT